MKISGQKPGSRRIEFQEMTDDRDQANGDDQNAKDPRRRQRTGQGAKDQGQQQELAEETAGFGGFAQEPGPDGPRR